MKSLIIMILIMLQSNCSKSSSDGPVANPPITNPQTGVSDVDFWLTKGDQTVKLSKVNSFLQFGTIFNSSPSIKVDDTQTFQTIDGFGYTLTGGSAQVINTLNPAKKTELLQEVFGNNGNGIGVSYLRISIGASDLNQTVFTYNDGAIDPTLSNFSLTQDNEVIALLKEILLINPNIKIMGSPWTPPKWMKDNNSYVGGKLLTQYYNLYAQYFVKYIQKMKVEGITIDAITIQNEPENPLNNPSMDMTASEQTNFIKNSLGPAFQLANITTKIICFDHNCDNPNYPISILNDATANNFVDGSAFHLYLGDINNMSLVKNAHPSKNIYFTEQWTSSTGSFNYDLNWHLKNVIIGSMRNFSKTALAWNLANNTSIGPSTPGGCSQCLGAITITGSDSYNKNVAFYTIAHASKFVPAGSIRISSNTLPNLNSVAFKTPSGKKVLIVQNDATVNQTFKINFNNKWITTSLDSKSVGTFTW